MNSCSAPWFELNISAPDNVASACCYYHGPKEAWAETPKDLDRFWNGDGMRRIRRIQNGKLAEGEHNGCANCFFFANRRSGAAYFDFADNSFVMSDDQRRNFQLAKQEFESGAEHLTCTPLRLYMNFGFTCNLSCTMCLQVPRRGELKGQVLAENILAWDAALRGALDVTVIGGEPFALPEAVKFIRSFIENPDYEPVRLTVCTNGTVHHKHWDTIRKKRNLSFVVSLDSINEGYEAIRVGSNWDIVERNILMVQESIKTDRPDWFLQTNGLILKTGVPYLPKFAEWHAKHGIVTSFYDFTNSRGTEDAFYTENILHNPQILDDMPEWESYFADAVSTFKKAGLGLAASSLDHFRERVVAARLQQAEQKEQAHRTRMRNDWNSLLHAKSVSDMAPADLIFVPGPNHLGDPPIDREHDPILFTTTRSGDHFTTPFIPVKPAAGGGHLRLQAHWPLSLKTRRAHVVIQRENFYELESFRTFGKSAFADELTIVASLPEDVQAVRILITPVGEEASALPQTFRVDIDSESTEVSSPHTSLDRVADEHRPAAEAVSELVDAPAAGRDADTANTGFWSAVGATSISKLLGRMTARSRDHHPRG